MVTIPPKWGIVEDAASSRTSHCTAHYAEDLRLKRGITIIPSLKTPVKSPDASPMDFYGFGILKQRLFQRRARTLDGLWKVLKDEWSKITPEEVTEVFGSWKRRLRAISELNGEHVENTKRIHRRVIKGQN